MSQPDHNLVRKLFKQAILLPAASRDTFLQKECGDDLVTRRAVRHLLDYHRTSTILSGEYETEASDVTGVSTQIASNSIPSLVSRISLGMSTSFFKNERKRLGLAIVLIVLTFSLAAYGVERAIQNYVREEVATTMQALLDEQVFAIELWLDAEIRVYEGWAKAEEVVAAIESLEEQIQGGELTGEQISQLGGTLRSVLLALPENPQELKYAVWNREYELIADWDAQSPAIGNLTTDYGTQILSHVFRGDAALWIPSTDGFMAEGNSQPEMDSRPEIAVVVPVRDSGGRVIAALVVSGLQMQTRFETLLKKVRYGESGEAYAIDRNGFLITESRFSDQLRESDLIPNTSDSFSAGLLRVAVPEGNIYQQAVNTSQMREWPLTKAARLATRKESSSDFHGYQDYRGVQVVGAWAWLDRFGFAIVLESDYSSAFRPTIPLRIAYCSLFALSILVLLGLILRWRSNLAYFRRMGIEKQIGPYQVHERIGEGGLAQVYLATHSLLKRPTALKLLKPTQKNPQNLVRFEREVQLASRLSHPNSIEIYDYGVTKRGEFFCAMEFISGFSLQKVVELDGALPVPRAVHILKSICRSLQEAHSLGLIHRDIKPQNIMLSERGGEADFVTVLDFGLAREIDSEVPSATATQVLVGTPMFIAPERIADPKCLDPRSDIFSLGIVGFILLTGREPHEAANSVDLLRLTMQSEPARPSQISPQDIPTELDDLIFECQMRNADLRPQSVHQILERLAAVPVDGWTQASAKKWWADFSPLIHD